MHDRRQPGRWVGQHVVQLLDLAVIGVRATFCGLGCAHLRRQILIVYALDGGDLGPLAQEPEAKILCHRRALHHDLAGIARRCRVGDVVAGCIEPYLRGVEGALTNTEYVGSHLSVHR